MTLNPHALTPLVLLLLIAILALAWLAARVIDWIDKGRH